LQVGQEMGVCTQRPATQVSVVQGSPSSQLIKQPPQLAGSFWKSGEMTSPCALWAGTALVLTSIRTTGWAASPVMWQIRTLPAASPCPGRKPAKAPEIAPPARPLITCRREGRSANIRTKSSKRFPSTFNLLADRAVPPTRSRGT
jgi:hypothetical protein